MRTAGLRPLPGVLLGLTVAEAVASVPLSAGLEAVYDTILYPLNGVVLALAGALITSRLRAHPIGWILLGLGLEAAFVELTEGYGYHASYSGSVVSEWVSSWGSILGASTLAIVLALFPTGRVAGRRWRPVLWSAIAGNVLIVIGTALGHSNDDNFRSGSNPYAVGGPGIVIVNTVGQVLFGVALLGAIASLIVRFRGSTGVERQQLKWVAYVVCALAVVGPLAIAFYFDSAVIQVGIAVVATALPVAICVAILRYRLYDIDLIISHTLVYGMLSVLLAAAYVAAALVLGAIAGSRHSAWVTAGATLAAVAVFQPLRRRVQDGVDRRFRKARYETLARVEDFLEELRAGRIAPDGLAPLLREVLVLPDLKIYYVLPDEAGHIDDRGRDVVLDRADGRIPSSSESARRLRSSRIPSLMTRPWPAPNTRSGRSMKYWTARDWRSRSPGSRPRSGTSWPRCRHRALASSRPVTPNVAGSSETCTTAPSNASSASDWPCDTHSTNSARRRSAGASSKQSPKSASPSPTCGNWRMGYVRRTSTTGSASPYAS